VPEYTDILGAPGDSGYHLQMFQKHLEKGGFSVAPGSRELWRCLELKLFFLMKYLEFRSLPLTLIHDVLLVMPWFGLVASFGNEVGTQNRTEQLVWSWFGLIAFWLRSVIK
jgi:hypothetical protein